MCSRRQGSPRTASTCFAGTGVRVTDVVGVIKAGDSAETVADEFGLDIADVRTSARILLGHAA